MRIFYIMLSIILLISTQAKSQARGPLSEPDHKVIKFYPNPAISYITFELVKAEKPCTLQIYSFLGRMVKNVADIQDKTTVNLSDLNRGIYTFQLKDEGGRITDSGIFQVIK
ncbi:MAG TPA: T9SS type A sorting domain-containing protein [Puia sp.]|uniref:T9SS type A sorting domain-containing protein n=1 Tax=Puia sp. TaxID=2045100 RepID=UPI002C6266EC|nr:T9SS type A sorting domain-containing protein [Puia sp.]HVU95057.1 T9SS type A sorting domain-containing protein [Puia sp.]